MLQSPLSPERFDLNDERYSPQTHSAIVEWITCIGTGVHHRREQASFDEADAEEVKAECRAESSGFVESMVADLGPSTDEATARQIAQSILDSVDPRLAFTPKAPVQLSKLPVSRLVGDWRSGRGPLATHLSVSFSADGALVGSIFCKCAQAADGLVGWKVVSEGTEEAVFYARFMDGRTGVYERIPSFPGEMNFISVSDPAVQRFDLKVENGDLFLSYVKPDSGTSLRFTRHFGSAEASNSE